MPEPLTIATLIGTVSAGIDLAEQAGALVRGWKTATEYKRGLFESVEIHVLSSNYQGGSRQFALDQLDKASTIRADFLTATTREEFASCLKRMDVLGPNKLTSGEALFLDWLVELKYAFGATHQDLILRDDVTDLKADIQGLYPEIQGLREVLVESKRLEDAFIPLPTGISADGKMSTDIIYNQGTFPLLTTWSKRLEYATSYDEQVARDQPIFQAYSNLVAEAREGPSNELETEFENVAVLAVEGQPGEALARLETLEVPLESRNMFQKILYHRLRGALLLELGKVRAARDAFDRAQQLIGKTSEQQKQWPSHHWLDQKLRHDLLNLSSLDTRDEHFWRDVKAMQLIDAWPSHPAIDRAVAQLHSVLAKEHFQVAIQQETTYRSSDFMRETLLYVNRALLLAYLSGDHHNVRRIRREFSTALVALYRNRSNVEVNRLIIEELLRTGHPDVIAQFLQVNADQVADLLDWSDVIARLKPLDIEDHDLNSYRWVRSRLAVIQTMSPYLTRSTIDELNEEFTNEAVAFSASPRVGLVRGESFRESYFIDAFTHIENLTPKQLGKLIYALDGNVGFHRLSFWEVIAVHSWQPEERAIAEMTLEQFEGKTFGYFDGGDVIARVLWNIGVAFPELRFPVERWLAANATVDANTKSHAYTYFLLGKREESAPDIKTWITGIYEHHLASMALASAKKSTLDARRILLLPLATRTYPEVFPDEQRFEFVTGLLQAAKNPNCSPVQKVDAFKVASELIPSLRKEQQDKLRERLISGEDAYTSATQPHQLGSFGLNQDAVRASFYKLRWALRIDPSQSELTFIAHALLMDAQSETLGEVYLAAEELLKLGYHTETLLYALYQATFNGSRQDRALAQAVRVLVRNIPPKDALLHEMIVERLESMLENALAPVQRAIMIQLSHSWLHLSEQLQSRFLIVAQDVVSGNKNRFARGWVKELIDNAAKVTDDESGNIRIT